MVKSLSRIQWPMLKPHHLKSHSTSCPLWFLSSRRPLTGRLQRLPVPTASSAILATTPTTWIRHHGGSSHHHHGDGGHHVHTDLATTLKESGKRGMQITLVGLVANIGLTASKGVAGWYMNSASLLADAAHSLSDLLSDFVTLYTFKMSRKLPDGIYPYGYGKYETVGSFAVSTLLITGGIAIGLHSFDLFIAVMNAAPTTTVDTAASSSGMIDSVSNSISSLSLSSVDATAVSSSSPSSSASDASHQPSSALSTVTSSLFHHHHHHDSTTLDPNAAWFALTSIIIKEWLYRATMKIGQSEHSDVLIANAWHHRSDAFSSMIALVAIGGSYAGMPVLDPLGGLIVAGYIVKSGGSILSSSVQELIDKGLPPNEIDQIKTAIAKVKEQEPQLIDFYSIRGRKLGPFKHLDLILQLDPKLSVEQAHRIEQLVRTSVKKEVSMVQEILIHVDAEKQPPHH